MDAIQFFSVKRIMGAPQHEQGLVLTENRSDAFAGRTEKALLAEIPAELVR